MLSHGPAAVGARLPGLFLGQVFQQQGYTRKRPIRHRRLPHGIRVLGVADGVEGPIDMIGTLHRRIGCFPGRHITPADQISQRCCVVSQVFGLVHGPPCLLLFTRPHWTFGA